eukprot:XP_001692667.1 predicted protein [Chlamydomonas reinhardtii]
MRLYHETQLKLTMCRLGVRRGDAAAQAAPDYGQPRGLCCTTCATFHNPPQPAAFKNQNEVNFLPLELSADEVTLAVREGVSRVGWRYPATAQEVLRHRVFSDMHRQGFTLTGGIKFGADMMAYPGDPSLYHAQFTVRPVPEASALNPMSLKAVARGSHAARKHLLLAFQAPGGQQQGQQQGPAEPHAEAGNAHSHSHAGGHAPVADGPRLRERGRCQVVFQSAWEPTSKGRALPPRPTLLVGEAGDVDACRHSWRQLQPRAQELLVRLRAGGATPDEVDSCVRRFRSLRESLVAAYVRDGLAVQVYEASADVCCAAGVWAEALKHLPPVACHSRTSLLCAEYGILVIIAA